MLAAYLNSLNESINRRMALVAFGLAIILSIVFNWGVHLKPIGTDFMVLLGNRALGPASLAVPALFSSEAKFTGFIWLVVGIFAAVPVIASTLDKGWLELTFSKGTARWRIMLGSYFGGITIYVCTLAVAALPLAFRLWLVTGIGPKPLLVALAIQTVGFAALVALAMFATLPQLSSALAMVIALVVWIASPYLAQRQDSFYTFFTSSFSRGIIEWVYRILPKTSELDGLSASYITDGHLTSWWPIWSTMVFTLVMISVSLYALRRKSF
jgi:ABC-type transport system involved in multi-copper enzyme maturation permease subunit